MQGGAVDFLGRKANGDLLEVNVLIVTIDLL